jgi:hypothetical protein
MCAGRQPGTCREDHPMTTMLALAALILQAVDVWLTVRRER